MNHGTKGVRERELMRARANQVVYFEGQVRQWVSSPPAGSGSYSVVAKVWAHAITYDGSAVANFFYNPPQFIFYTFVGYIEMSD
jgi:hypothetical protein